MQHDVKSWYNGLTDKWEKCYSSKKKHFVQRLKNVHVLVKELKKNANILDIGCGTGEITSSLHKRFGCNTIGIDISQKMVEHCRSRYTGKNLHFEEGNISDLKFQSRKFDLTLSLSIIEWLVDYEKAIKEVARVLKHNGQWIVSLPNWASPFRKIEYLKSKFSKDSYLKYQKNSITIPEFLDLARTHGLEIRQSIFHVLPLLASNLKGRIGSLFGMMCILSMEKVNNSR